MYFQFRYTFLVDILTIVNIPISLYPKIPRTYLTMS